MFIFKKIKKQPLKRLFFMKYYSTVIPIDLAVPATISDA